MMASSASRADSTVLLIGELPGRTQLTSLLVGRGLHPEPHTDSWEILPRLALARAGAAIVAPSDDATADMTRQLRMLEADSRLVLVWVGGAPSARVAVGFLQAGAVGCLPADCEASLVVDVLVEGLAARSRLLAEDRQVAGFRHALKDLNGQLDREMATVQDRWIGSLESLVRIGEVAHPHFHGHALRVADLATTIAAAMGESDEFLNHVRLAGRLHDLGMIGVPARLLEKAGALTDKEFELIQQHPRLASDMLSGYPDFAEVTRAIRGHHEHWDGSGYPDQLVGNDIPRMARILAVAEVFDALTSARPYQPAEGVAHALRRVEHLSGSVLDPGICALLPEIFGRRDSLTFVHDLPAARTEVPPANAA